MLIDKNRKKTAISIANDSNSWMRQYEYIAPAEIKRRRKNAHGVKDFFRTIVGLFVKPKLKNIETLYVFEGLRNKEYIGLFAPDSVVIVGSHQEKQYAELHGHLFCWAFPIMSAVHSKMYRNWTFPVTHQIDYWESALSGTKKVYFFLYEDTQPLGVFFIHLGRLLRPKTTSICIQHGYFGFMNYELRCEGQLSDVNFVWDKVQADLIGGDKSRMFEVGLPYDAWAGEAIDITVILVGTGMADYGNDSYQRSLEVFLRISHELRSSVKVDILYRPHPNEWGNKSAVSNLREKFTLLDELSKVERLNGPKAVFVGTTSSLLYEAGVAGHLVAYLNIYDKEMAAFSYDIKFGQEDINNFVDWAAKLKADQLPKNSRKSVSSGNYADRFIFALDAAKLIGKNGAAK